jgi:DNA mismatch repair protein MutS2
MDDRTLATLEIDALLALVARHVQTPLGRDRAANLRPSTDRNEIEQRLNLTSECAEYLRSGERFGLSGIENPDPALAKLQVEGTSLDPRQILVLERLIAVGVDLRELFRDQEQRARFPHLAHLAARIADLRRVLSSIRGKILPGGEVDDNASPELRAVRRELGEARSRIYRTLESILKNQPRAVQEELVTFRNGRFVIPIRTDSRNLVPGVVHGLSSSGQTTFVEPLTAIDQNNELVRLREQEEIEISRILFSISESLRVSLPAIIVIRDTIAEVDFAQARGRLSLEFRCVRPQLAADRFLRLVDARHLLLEHGLRSSSGTVVPISIELDQTHNVAVISGPNAGGKTVVLKTVGLAALMAQMGLHIPAREAVLPVFAQVYADIGDQQSIAANLSTFTAHMRNIAEMAERVSPSALLLLDEVGTGTDPDEGTALAIAIVDFFRSTGALTIATTHYSGLKMWASQAEGVRNASVEFDERTLRPTFRLILGVAGASSGIEIARRMNVPPAILRSAQTRIDPTHAQATEYLKKLKATVDEQESLRAALAEEREATAARYASLDLEFAQREAGRRAAFEEEMTRVVREFTGESDRLIRGIKDRIEAERLRKAAANRAADLRRTGERLKKGSGSAAIAGAGPPERTYSLRDAGGPMQEGDRVHIASLDKEGVVDSVQDGTITVRVGSLKFRARAEELALIQPAGTSSQPETKAESRRPSAASDLDQQFGPELNVIGMTADEATDRVDKFLDQAFLAGAETIRIIHGHGKGILRRAIAQLLDDHPQVERFQLAPPDKGGGGATVVELRK